jgi:glucose/arabinose dehydrogenase
LIYQATASDPDGDTIGFSLSGADASRFTITSAGQLSFVSSPNFDLPTDTSRDNVYDVDVTASDGKASTVLPLKVSVTNSKEGVAVRRIATGFTNPVAIAPVSDTAVLVAEKAGAIYLLNPQTGTRALLVQIAEVGTIGVTALAAAPTFASDGAFFAMYTSGGALVISQYLRNPAGPTVPSNFGPVLQVRAPEYAGGGWLGIDAAGDLLAATGDAGRNGDVAGSAQDDNSLLGKVLRLRRNPDPYAGASVSFFNISTVAKGLHRPNGGSQIGAGLLIADHGQDVAEELDLIASGPTMHNFGWPFKEGTRVVQGTAPTGLIEPVLEYFRSNGLRTGQSIMGGGRGPSSVASLLDQYVFGDAGGAIFTVPVASLVAGTTLTSDVIERRDADFAPDQGTIEHPAVLTGGPGGTIYIADADGEIYLVSGG